MPRNYWETVSQVIESSDIILMVMDARNPDATRNREIEAKVKGKPVIYVLNKSDLAKDSAIKMPGAISVSSKDYTGIGLLKRQIQIEGKRLKISKPRVGVLGYPNMGKSSLINALGGRGKANVSPISGFTKGKKDVKFRAFVLIDTPGVIPFMEKDDITHSVLGINTNIKEPDAVVLKLLEQHPGAIERRYLVAVQEDKESTLEEIAAELNFMLKGGKPDTVRAAKKILAEISSGKLRINI